MNSLRLVSIWQPLDGAKHSWKNKWKTSVKFHQDLKNRMNYLKIFFRFIPGLMNVNEVMKNLYLKNLFLKLIM